MWNLHLTPILSTSILCFPADESEKCILGSLSDQDICKIRKTNVWEKPQEENDEKEIKRFFLSENCFKSLYPEFVQSEQKYSCQT